MYAFFVRLIFFWGGEGFGLGAIPFRDSIHNLMQKNKNCVYADTMRTNEGDTMSAIPEYMAYGFCNPRDPI